MKHFYAWLLVFVQFCATCNPAQAGSPFIWGADSRAQGLQASGVVFSNGQPVDYNGSINKIANNEAIINTSGWSTYADAAGATPVDCTGGSPNITWTRSTSTPLRGSANFLATKDAANRQGEGIAYAFSLDNADAVTGKTITLSFDASGGTNYVAGDHRIYVYDVTNATLITPISTSVGSSTANFLTSFAATTSTSYRLCIHTATTNASAYTVRYDSFFVGPPARDAAFQPGNAQIRLDTGNGRGGTNINIRRFTNCSATGGGSCGGTGSAMSYADSAPNGMTLTIQEAGVYAFTYSDASAAASNIDCAITLNEVGTLSSEPSVMGALYRLAVSTEVGAGAPAVLCAVTVRLQAGDIIRAHPSTNATSTANYVQFIATQIFKG